jgi:PucR family transcriptional regulator, purine catabolism regulatory protein
MTINELLQLESMKNSRILAGNEQEISITGVNVMEVPDIVNWVKKGEFLMTAGYSYRNKHEEFAELIPQLAQKGIASLGIKVHRYFETIPQAIIDNANKCGLPIIEISEDVVFSNVVREVIQSLSSEEYMSVSGIIDKIRKLSELILGGFGIESIVKALADYMENPVIVVCNDGECTSAGLSAEDVYTEDMDEKYQYNNLHEKQGWMKLMIGVRQCKTYFYDIIQKNEQIARVYLLEKNRDISNADMNLIEQSSFMIGMELQSENVRIRVEMKYVDQLFQNWILGKIENASSFKMQCEVCKISIPEMLDYKACIIYPGKELPEEQMRNLLIRLRKNLKSFNDIYITYVNDQIVAVFVESNEKQYCDLIMSLVKGIMGSKYQMKLCIGKKSGYYYNLYESYKDACHIMKVSIRYKINGGILHYKDMGVYSLLYLIPIGQELDEYLDRYIKPLINYDGVHQTNMYETLKVYLDMKGNVKATAEKLFMHYNTISYRLERIRKIMGMDIGQHEIQFSLHIAIKINDMYL